MRAHPAPSALWHRPSVLCVLIAALAALELSACTDNTVTTEGVDTAPSTTDVADAGAADAPRANDMAASVHPSGWREVSPTGIAREGSSIVTLADGRVLVTSGHRLQPFTTELDPALPEDSAEVYDPAQDVWEATPLMASGHFGGPSALLADGRVLVAGGWPQSEAHDVEIFDPQSWTWGPAAPMARRRQGFDLVPTTGGGLLAVGGIDWVTDGELVTDVERYEPDTDSWKRLADLPEPRIGRVVPWRDGHLLLFGGDWDTTTWTYEPDADTWSPGPAVTGRRNDAVLVLSDGRTLRAGGLAFESFDDGKIATADLLDPVTGENVPTGSMNHVRSLFALAELHDGRVLATGGSGDGQDGLASAEIWDPTTGEWTLAEPMHRKRWNHGAVPISGGTEVLIIGGYSHEPLPQAMQHCEVFRP